MNIQEKFFMKRKFYVMLLILICLSSGIYCGGDGSSGDKTNNSSGKVTMTGMMAKSDSIDLVWTNPAGVTLGRIDISWTGSSDSGSAQVTDGSTEYTISGLSATTKYTISLTVVNSSNKSSDAVSFSVSTSAADKTYCFIYTAADLNAVRGGSTLAGNYILMADISLSDYASGEGWVPIGDSTTAFTGIFDGNAHTISGLTINRSGNDQGLFGCVGSAGTITNLKLECNKVTGNDDVGALAGESSGTISNSYAAGEISGANGAGGLVGYNNSGAIDNSYSSCKVSGSSYYVGGLVGSNSGTISNSYAIGAVSGGTDDSTGGLVGNNSGTIINSYAIGAVSGTSTVSGLVGYYSNLGSITNCYYDSDTTGRSDSYAVGYTTAQMKLQDASIVYDTDIYVDWDFAGESDNGTEEIWSIDTTGAVNSGYPYLTNNP